MTFAKSPEVLSLHELQWALSSDEEDLSPLLYDCEVLEDEASQSVKLLSCY